MLILIEWFLWRSKRRVLMQTKTNDAELESDYTDLMCSKCNVNLEIGPVSLEYLGNGFPVELPKCPKPAAKSDGPTNMQSTPFTDAISDVAATASRLSICTATHMCWLTS